MADTKRVIECDYEDITISREEGYDGSILYYITQGHDMILLDSGAACRLIKEDYRP